MIEDDYLDSARREWRRRLTQGRAKLDKRAYRRMRKVFNEIADLDAEKVAKLTPMKKNNLVVRLEARSSGNAMKPPHLERNTQTNYGIERRREIN